MYLFNIYKLLRTHMSQFCDNYLDASVHNARMVARLPRLFPLALIQRYHFHQISTCHP